MKSVNNSCDVCLSLPFQMSSLELLLVLKVLETSKDKRASDLEAVRARYCSGGNIVGGLRRWRVL